MCVKAQDQLLPINKFSARAFLFESARPIRKGLQDPFCILIGVILILIVEAYNTHMYCMPDEARDGQNIALEFE